MFDSKVHAPEADVGVAIYLFPDMEELVELMQDTDI